MRIFDWDEDKAASNLCKHGVAFEDAALVWADPLHVVLFDRFEGGEERWRVLGIASGTVVLLVAHTYPDEGDEVVRIVSARRATRHERRVYEDGDFN